MTTISPIRKIAPMVPPMNFSMIVPSRWGAVQSFSRILSLMPPTVFWILPSI